MEGLWRDATLDEKKRGGRSDGVMISLDFVFFVGGGGGSSV